MSEQRRTHLIDPTFEHVERTYCGLGGAALPTTADLGKATCKACIRLRRRLDREREARAIARQVKP